MSRSTGRTFAFLRGMNLGKRRIRNEELCARFEAMGFGGVSAFLASGNVVFDTRETDLVVLRRRIEDQLGVDLGYPVPTVLRSAEELEAIAAREPFSAAQLTASKGKPQVALLAEEPSEAARQEVSALSCPEDRLALHGRELHWLPIGGVSESELDFKALDRALGLMTLRTRNTLLRMVAKFLPG